MAESVIGSPYAVESATPTVNIDLTSGSINATKNNRVVVVSIAIRPSSNVTGGTVLCTVPYPPAAVYYGTMADASDSSAKIVSIATNGELKTMIALTAGHWIEGSFSYIV